MPTLRFLIKPALINTVYFNHVLHYLQIKYSQFYLSPIFKLQLHLSALKLKPNFDMKKELEGFMLRLSL